MAWNEALTELRDLFAALYDAEGTIRIVLDQAEVPTGEVDFDGGVIQIWHSALTMAQRRKRIDELAAVVRGQFSERAAEIDQHMAAYHQLVATTPTVGDDTLHTLVSPDEPPEATVKIPKNMIFAVGGLLVLILLLVLFNRWPGTPGAVPLTATVTQTPTVQPTSTVVPTPTHTATPLSLDGMLRQADELTPDLLLALQRHLRGPAPIEDKIEKVAAMGRPGWIDAIPLLIEIVRSSDDTQTKSNAVWALGQIGGLAAQDALIQLLITSPHDSLVRQSCIKTLVRISLPNLPAAAIVTESVRRILIKEADVSMQMLAIETLGLLRADDAVDDIILALRTNPVEEVRTQAAKTLVYFPESTAARVNLQRTARDTRELEATRLATIETLLRLGDLASLEIFDEIRQNSSTDALRQAAQDAYIRIRNLSELSANSIAATTAAPLPSPTSTPIPILQKGMQGTAKTAVRLYIEPQESAAAETLSDDATITFVVTDPTAEWAFVQASDSPTGDRTGWVKRNDFDWFVPVDRPIVRGKLWPNGRVITVGFLEGASELQEQVKQYAIEWTEYANLTFEFIDHVSEADIRISFDRTSGSWSYIGTDNLSVPRSSATMNLGLLTLDVENDFARGTILHEFGHAIGLYHEHLNPNHTIPWDRERAYAYFSRQGWSEARVDQNLFATWGSETFPLDKPFDPESVMLYAFPNEVTEGDYPMVMHNAMSAGDKAFIQLLYPKPEEQRGESATDSLAPFTQPVGLLQANGNPLCTAAIVAEQYIITADFCTSANVQKVTLVMGFTAADVTGEEYTVQPQPVEFNEDLHYAIYEVEGNPAATYGTVPLVVRMADVGESMFGAMYVMGEPLVLTDNRCLVRELDPPNLRHSCETGGGSAGALLIAANDFAILGLHHSARTPDQTGERGGTATLFTEIVANSAILRKIVQQAAIE